MFTPSNAVTDTVMLMGKMGRQSILPVTVPVKKIKGAARQIRVKVMEPRGVNRPLEFGISVVLVLRCLHCAFVDIY